MELIADTGVVTQRPLKIAMTDNRRQHSAFRVSYIYRTDYPDKLPV